MISGLGTDIIEIERIRAAVDRNGQAFLDRVFTKKEQEYCQKQADPMPRYAARFAAKEAVVKALGTGLRGGLAWTDIEIVVDGAGKPTALFEGQEIMISMSHSHNYATAVAIIQAS